MSSLLFDPTKKFGNKRKSKRFKGPNIKYVSSREEFFALINNNLKS